MKSLKIRAWDKELKEMKVWDFRDIWESELMPDFDEYEFMQFTGLLDKNGKEIYEGDIIQSDNFFLAGKKLIVTWNEEEANFYGKLIVEIPDILGTKNLYEQPVEVIGNIYENLELLEAE